MLITATAIGAAVSIPRRDIALPLVLLWAFLGIIVKHQNTPGVAFWASIASGLVALVILAALVLRRREPEVQP
jgi:membrane associated rhomboid family serine protease